MSLQLDVSGPVAVTAATVGPASFPTDAGIVAAPYAGAVADADVYRADAERVAEFKRKKEGFLGLPGAPGVFLFPVKPKTLVTPIAPVLGKVPVLSAVLKKLNVLDDDATSYARVAPRGPPRRLENSTRSSWRSSLARARAGGERRRLAIIHAIVPIRRGRSPRRARRRRAETLVRASAGFRALFLVRRHLRRRSRLAERQEVHVVEHPPARAAPAEHHRFAVPDGDPDSAPARGAGSDPVAATERHRTRRR